MNKQVVSSFVYELLALLMGNVVTRAPVRPGALRHHVGLNEVPRNETERQPDESFAHKLQSLSHFLIRQTKIICKKARLLQLCLALASPRLESKAMEDKRRKETFVHNVGETLLRSREVSALPEERHSFVFPCLW